MRFETYSHRNADIILEQKYPALYQEVKDVIFNISDRDIVSIHGAKYSTRMSLSYAINELLRQRFVEKGWLKEAAIFQAKELSKDKKWRLDFAKGDISIEVAFNHGEAIAWNLVKPVLASEKNHVEKAVETKVGVLICATKELKRLGGFDGAVGEYEKVIRYLLPMNYLLSVPMLIIGLKAPETFSVKKVKTNGKNIGHITPLPERVVE